MRWGELAEWIGEDPLAYSDDWRVAEICPDVQVRLNGGQVYDMALITLECDSLVQVQTVRQLDAATVQRLLALDAPLHSTRLKELYGL